MPAATPRPPSARPGRFTRSQRAHPPCTRSRAWRLPRQAGCILLLAGCGPDASTTPAATAGVPEHEPGVVLLVDGLPLRKEEVAALSADISALYPEYTPLHVLRLALTNEFLPRLAAHALDPSRWQAARAACEALGDPAELAQRAVEHEGHFHALGLPLWSAARHLAPGEWSAPLELTGRWLRLRLDELNATSDPQRETLRVAVVEFPYLDPAQSEREIERAIERAHLTLIDPGFTEAIPEAWKLRMHGSAMDGTRETPR